jgi:hypothetical protein
MPPRHDRARRLQHARGATGWQGARAVACPPALTGNPGIGAAASGAGTAAAGGHGLADIAEPARRPPGHYVPNQMPRITEPRDTRRARAVFFGTGMLSSFADSGRVERALARQDLIVVQTSSQRHRAPRRVRPGTAWAEGWAARPPTPIST